MAILPGDIITADALVTDVNAAFTGTTHTISTSEGVAETFTIDIPSDWTEYDVHIMAFCDVFESTAASGTPTITLRIRSGTTTAGTLRGSIAAILGNAAPDNAMPTPLGGSVSAATATGTQSFVLTSQASTDSGLFSVRNVKIFTHAFRTD